MGVSGCGQIVVNRKHPHAPSGVAGGQSMRTQDFGERSVFGASSTTIRSPQHATEQPAFSRASPMTSTNDRDTSTSEHPCSRSLNSSFNPRSPQAHPPPQTSPRLAQQQTYSPGSPHRGSTVLSMSTLQPRSHPARMSLSLHAASGIGLPFSAREHNSSPPVTPPSRPVASGGRGRQRSPKPPSPISLPIQRPTLRPAPSSTGMPKSPMRLNTTSAAATPGKSPHRPPTISAFPQLPSPQSNNISSSKQQQQQHSTPQRGAGSGASQSANLTTLLSSIRTSTATEGGVSPRRDQTAPSSASATIDRWFGGNGVAGKRNEDDEDASKVRFLPTQHPKPKNDTLAERRRLLLRGNRK
jgi:hypothetical protein